MAGKFLVYDIENMAMLGWFWPPAYETSILHTEHSQHLLSIAYKWVGEKKTHCICLPDYKLYKTEPHNDRELAKDFWNVLNEADAVIGHNSDQFDVKMVNSMFMRHKMTPPSAYKQLDTKKIAKKYGRFASNKLDDLGEEFNIGHKKKHDGFPLWLGCDSGDKKAWKKMVDYNIQDVRLTEKLYLELRPWVDNHPSFNVLNGTIDRCNKCGGSHLTKQGFKITKTGKFQQYKCQDCGGWNQARFTEPQIQKIQFTN